MFQDNIDILIALQIDHPDRLRNLSIVTNYLKKIGMKSVYVYHLYQDVKYIDEVDKRMNGYHAEHEHNDKDYFNKMYCFNKACDKTSSSVIALYDVDVLVKNTDFQKGYNMLQTDCEASYPDYDVIYPYNGHMYNLNQEYIVKMYKNEWDFEIETSKCELMHPNSVGGCVMFNREVFIKGGKCNENIKNVGYDDDEIFRRFYNKGFKIGRTKSPIFHLKHFRSENVYENNKYIKNNLEELKKVL